MTKSLTFLFPGQGSQYPGMGKEFCENYPIARHCWEEADEALGFPISRLCFEGPAEDLQLTTNTQPALLACALATFRVFTEQGMAAAYMAGHSLGEHTALVAAGSLSFADALRLVRLRGQFMQEAVPVGTGAMAALLGLKLELVEQVCRESAQGEVVQPANINTPEQIVIAGHAGAVKRAIENALAAGAKRAVPLPVSAPFHSSLMEPARKRLAPIMESTHFADLATPLVNNVRAEVVRSGQEARRGILEQISSPVLWEQDVRKLISLGTELFIEVGPGRVLSGLIRQIDRSAATTNVEDMKSMDKALAAIANSNG
ncbi:MAG: [acyl-carrier-protein] S-malonyltransferase [Acidobacteria bacterium RIFCSPLOWO2_12_FULL_54_10]|nr:MAG: [acyl-carrier-protein] S-malonyltransferase [Acidobacteria bacterium RIFCSPLOWO2_12_FULL_54_10]